MTQSGKLFLKIIEHVERYGFQPSAAEMAGMLRLSTRAVKGLLVELEDAGVLRVSGRDDRALVLPFLRFHLVRNPNTGQPVIHATE